MNLSATSQTVLQVVATLSEILIDVGQTRGARPARHRWSAGQRLRRRFGDQRRYPLALPPFRVLGCRALPPAYRGLVRKEVAQLQRDGLNDPRDLYFHEIWTDGERVMPIILVFARRGLLRCEAVRPKRYRTAEPRATAASV